MLQSAHFDRVIKIYNNFSETDLDKFIKHTVKHHKHFITKSIEARRSRKRNVFDLASS